MPRRSSRKSTHTNTRSASRRGVVVLEAILVLPILLLVTFAVFEFAAIVLLQNAASQAAASGAREIAKGGTVADVVNQVDLVLAPHNLAVGPLAAVRVEDPQAMIDEKQGDPNCDAPTNPVILNGNVRVTVCMPLTSVPLVGLLENFGVDLTGRSLHMSAVCRKEAGI